MGRLRLHGVARVALAAVALLVCSGLSMAQHSDSDCAWVSSWGSAVMPPFVLPGRPGDAPVTNKTVRVILHPTLSGSKVRVLISNAYGTTLLQIGAAAIADAGEGSRTVKGSDHALTFGGQSSIVVPPGAPVLSDPVAMPISSFHDVAVSLFLPVETSLTTTRVDAEKSSYIAGPGNLTMSSELVAAEAKTALYFVSGLEVWSGPGTSAIIALGDSITQGTTKVPPYSDYPDQLAERIAKGEGKSSVSVVNEGINGNRILHDVAGQNALARFDRDVAAQPGARAVIVMEGINDIGFPRVRFSEIKNMPVPGENPWKDQKVSADQIIQGLQQIVARAHTRGFRVFVATLSPFAGTNSFDEEGEAIRQSVNAWIRTGNGFDGVVDFDKVLRDASSPASLQPQFDSGDHIHPTAAGYKAMADSIDLVALLSTDAREKHREMTSK